MEDFLRIVSNVFLMVGLTAAIGIACGFPASLWIGGKVADFLSFLPRETFVKAPPALGIPASKAVRGDLEGAIAGYEELLAGHPEEKEIYHRILEIALGPLKMERYAKEVFRMAMENLTDPRDRRKLACFRTALRNGEYRPFRYLSPVANPDEDERIRCLLRLKNVPESSVVFARSQEISPGRVGRV